MKCPAILNRIWGAGLDLTVVGGSLRFSGSSRLPHDELEPLLAELRVYKAECIAFLRERAYSELRDMTRQGLLRWIRYPEGAFMLDHPLPPKRRYDASRVEYLRYQAHPLPYERQEELLGLQERAAGPPGRKFTQGSQYRDTSLDLDNFVKCPTSATERVLLGSQKRRGPNTAPLG